MPAQFFSGCGADGTSGRRSQGLWVYAARLIALRADAGHQMSEVDCNVYLITTPEGITLSHLGDQVNDGNFSVNQ